MKEKLSPSLKKFKFLILIICVLLFSAVNASATVVFEENNVFNFNSSTGIMTDCNGITYERMNNGYIRLNNERYIGFAIKGKVDGNPIYRTSDDFSWTWDHTFNESTHTFSAVNNVSAFQWTQSWHFYNDSETPMKIEHFIENNYADITETEMYYIMSVDSTDDIFYNNVRYDVGDYIGINEPLHQEGNFNSIIPKIQLPDTAFNFKDLIDNGFTINEFYIGDGSIIDKPSVDILAVGFTKGAGTFLSGTSITVDPTFSSNTVRCISMTPLDADSVVVAWLDYTLKNAMFAIYNVDGTVEVSPVTVDSDAATPSRISIEVDTFNSTHFVYAWHNQSGTGAASYAVYNSGGTLVSGPFVVDAQVGGSNAIGVSALNETHIAYAWYDYTTYNSKVAIYDSSGNFYGSAEVLADNYWGHRVDVTAINDTHFIYSFLDSAAADTSFIIYDTGLNVVTSITDVDDTSGSTYAHDIAIINETHFVFSWYDSTDTDITFSIYDTSGNLIVGPIDVNDDAGSAIRSTPLGMLDDTHFVIGVEDDLVDNITFSIYDTGGNLVTGPIEVYDQSGYGLSIASETDVNNIEVHNDCFLLAYGLGSGTGVWEAFDSSGAEWDGSLYTSTTASFDDIYGFSTGDIPSNATILSLKNEGITTVEYEIDWDNITSGVWTDVKEAMSYASSQNVRSALKFNFSGDYTSSAYRTQVKSNFSTYTPDLQGTTYWTNIKYITIDFDNGGATDGEKKDFGNEIAENLTAETDNKFTVITEESLTGLNPNISISPIKYITLSTKSAWIDSEVSTLRGSTTTLRMYSGVDTFLDTVLFYKTYGLDFMRDDSAVGSQYTETDTVKLDNGDVLFYNNAGSEATIDIASPATGYYFDTINDTYFNRSTAGTLSFKSKILSKKSPSQPIMMMYP